MDEGAKARDRDPTREVLQLDEQRAQRHGSDGPAESGGRHSRVGNRRRRMRYASSWLGLHEQTLGLLVDEWSCVRWWINVQQNRRTGEQGG